MIPWAALVACKAVLTVQQAAACRSVEFDVQIADDGVWVLSHDPVHGTSEELRGKNLSFDDFVDGLKGHRFDFVNVDVKERSFLPGDGRLSRALEREAAALTKLSAETGTLVATSPVPTRYAELERFIARTKTPILAGLELADYTAEDARRWGLPMTRLQAAVLPLGSLLNRLYLRWRGDDVKWLSVQERTAASMTPRRGRTVFCWSRDPESAPPPSLCRWTEREGSGAPFLTRR